MSQFKMPPIHILLADDDLDDCFFFEKALLEIPINIHFDTVRDGEQLMNYLYEHLDQLPDMLFLDLSMPLKTGFECLSEIKENDVFRKIHIVILSTSYSKDLNYEDRMIVLLRNFGAEQYIRKSNNFAKIIQVITNFNNTWKVRNI